MTDVLRTSHEQTDLRVTNMQDHLCTGTNYSTFDQKKKVVSHVALAGGFCFILTSIKTGELKRVCVIRL